MLHKSRVSKLRKCSPGKKAEAFSAAGDQEPDSVWLRQKDMP